MSPQPGAVPSPVPRLCCVIAGRCTCCGGSRCGAAGPKAVQDQSCCGVAVPQGRRGVRRLRQSRPALDRNDSSPLPPAPAASETRLAPQEAGRRDAVSRLVSIVSGWRWCRCRAGDCAKRTTRCRPDGSARAAPCRTSDRRSRACTNQAAAHRTLAGVIRVRARRQTQSQRQRDPARRNKSLRHVVHPEQSFGSQPSLTSSRSTRGCSAKRQAGGETDAKPPVLSISRRTFDFWSDGHWNSGRQLIIVQQRPEPASSERRPLPAG